jgi:hypothetical protein
MGKRRLNIINQVVAEYESVDTDTHFIQGDFNMR